MAFFKDIIQASSAFKNSMQGLARQEAFDRAESQVETIKASEKNAFEKQAKQRQIARQLSQDLIQAGQAPSTALQASSTFAPEPPTSPKEDIFRGVEALSQADTKEGKEAAMNMISRGREKQYQFKALDLQQKQQELRAKLRKEQLEYERKLSSESRKGLNKASKVFRRNNKKLIEKSLRPLKSLESFLTKPVGQNVDYAQLTTAMKALAKTVEGGRLTDQDFKLAVVNQDWASATWRQIERAAKGDAPIKDVNKLRGIAQALIHKYQRELSENVSSFARGRAPDIAGRPPASAVENKIRLEHNIPEPITRKELAMKTFERRAAESGIPKDDIQKVVKLSNAPTKVKNDPGVQKTLMSIVQQMRERTDLSNENIQEIFKLMMQ